MIWAQGHRDEEDSIRTLEDLIVHHEKHPSLIMWKM